MLGVGQWWIYIKLKGHFKILVFGVGWGGGGIDPGLIRLAGHST